MRKRIGISLVCLAATAVASAHSSTSLDDYYTALGAAQSLHVEQIVQTIGGAPARYTLDIARPNQARIDSPTQLIVADGTTIILLDKAENIYSRRPQTVAELKKMFYGDDMLVWGGFFDPEVAKVFSSRDMGTLLVGGQSLKRSQVVLDSSGRRMINYYFSPTDMIVRRAQLDTVSPEGVKQSKVLSAEDVRLGGPAASYSFANKSGATEVPYEDMLPLRWYGSVEDATRAAKASKRKILVHYYSSADLTTRKIEDQVFAKRTFRAYAKKLILCRVDVSVKSRSGSTTSSSMTSTTSKKAPTETVLDKDGTELYSQVGYTNADDFYAFLKAAMGE